MTQQAQVATRRPAWPVDVVERIRAARERGASFEAIAAELGVSFATVRNKAVALGLHAPLPRRRFTAEEDHIIRADYGAHVDIAVTAAKLGRSYGAVRQRIFHRMKDLLNQGRTPRSWRALRQYGVAMLEHGVTPDEAAVKVRRMVTAAKAAAKAAALEAKANRRQERIALMLEQIAAGRERDAAVFEARALGAALEDIGHAIGVTRERVRQICDQHAFRSAAGRLLADETTSRVAE